MRADTTPLAHVSLPTEKTRDRSKAPLPDRVDVAIIGAGVGGLSAGAHLAKAGFSVAVFDAHYVAGGCGTMFSRGKGDQRWTFDVGLHYVGDCLPGGDVATVLDPLGLEVTWESLDPDGFDEIILPDLSFKIPVDRALYRDRLVAAFPAEVKGIDKYIRLLEEVRSVTADMTLLDNPFRLIPHILRKGRLVALNQNATIGDFLDANIQDPNLKAVLLGQSGDYGVAPYKASAMLHCGLANHYFKGAFYPRGGGQVIADGLAEIIESNGGHVLLRRPIQRIVVEGGKAVGVTVDLGRAGTAEVRATHVISNADIIQTYTKLLPEEHVPAKLRKKRDGWEMASSLFMTCLGVKGDMADRGMRNANYWCYANPDFDAMYKGIDDGDMTPRVAYVTSGSLKDPYSSGHAPPGHTTVEIMAMMPGAQHWGLQVDPQKSIRYRGEDVYNAHKAHAEATLIDRLNVLFPGVKDDIVFTESATPATHSRFTWASDGSAYGLASTPDQMVAGRPGYRGPVGGMYLVGASTKAGHGIVGALTSGREVAKVVAKDAGRSLGLS